MKRKTILIIAVLALVVVGAVWFFLGRNDNIPEYQTIEVTRGDIENTVTAVGRLDPSEFVDVGAQVSGQLEKLYIRLDDNVQKGQLVAEIDPTVYNAMLKQAQTDLQNYRAQLNGKESALALSKQQNDRNEGLLRQKVIAPADVEVSRANYKDALAQVNAVKSQVQQAQATIDIASANLGYTRINAPMAGRVVSLPVVEGQTLNANQQTPVLMRIANMDTMTVTAQVSEADISKLKVGQPTYFTTLGQTEKYYSVLKQVLPTPEALNDVILYNVLFSVSNGSNTLKIGMTAQVFFVVDQAKNTLLIPQSALVYASGIKMPKGSGSKENGGTGAGKNVKVLVLKADGTLENRKITTGVSNDISIEVLSGLKEGEQVVTGVALATEPTVPKKAGDGTGKNNGGI